MSKPIPCPHKESTVQCPLCRRLYKRDKAREYRRGIRVVKSVKPSLIIKEIRIICSHGVYRTRCIPCRKEYNKERYETKWGRVGKLKTPFEYFQPILEMI